MGGGAGGANVIWASQTSSPVHVISPRSDNAGGSHATNRQNIAPIGERYYYWDIPYAYFHGIADDDNFAIFITGQEGLNDQDDPLWYSFMGFFLGTPQPNTNGGVDPYCCYSLSDEQLPFNYNSQYGNTSGSVNNQGGVKVPGGTVDGVYIYYATPAIDYYRQPNQFSPSGAVRDESEHTIYTYSDWIGYGHEPGSDGFLRSTAGVQCESMDATAERAAFGSNSTNNTKFTVPWPASIGEAPGGTRSTTGVLF